MGPSGPSGPSLISMCSPAQRGSSSLQEVCGQAAGWHAGSGLRQRAKVRHCPALAPLLLLRALQGYPPAMRPHSGW